MALSMDEQRILAEIERRLAADDPGLASCLSTFRRPGPRTVLRSPRARIIGSLFTVLLVALVSLMVYAMIPFRDHTGHDSVVQPTQTSSNLAISSAPSNAPSTVQSMNSSGTSAPPASATRTPDTTAPRAQASKAKATGTSAAPR